MGATNKCYSVHYSGETFSCGRLAKHYMNNKTLRIYIKLYSILLAIIGLLSMIFFFPSPHGCTDVKVCLAYSLCGLVMLIISRGLFLLNDRARKCMVSFSFIFIGFFIFETIWLVKNDFTGQGLVGLMLLYTAT